MLRQIFEFGLFHADPHPGNLLVLPGDKVAFLDFGMFARVDRRQRLRMGLMLWALVEGDHTASVDQLVHLSTRRPDADVRGFRTAVADLVEQWYGQRARDFSVARLLLAELGAGAAHGVGFPRELMLLARALVTLESTGTLVYPDLSLADLTEAVLPQLKRSLLPSPSDLAEIWAAARLDWLALALELPEVLPHLDGLLTERLTPTIRPEPPRSRLRGPALAAAAVAATVVVGAGRRRQQRGR